MRPIGYMKAGLVPKQHPSMLDISWAAGVIEGEGTFDLTRSKPHLQGSARVSAVQKKPWMMVRLKALFGGSIYTSSNQGLGNGDVTRWMLCGVRARGLMMTVYTFMSPHKKKIIKTILKGKFKPGRIL